MAAIIRIAFCVVSLIAVALSAALHQPEWARELKVNGWSLADPLLAEEKRSAELKQANLAEQRQLELRDRAMRSVLDGHATLFEAAAVFHRLNQDRLEAIQSEFPDCSMEEAACRQVIQWVRVETQEGDGSIVKRLEGELVRHKEQFGTVILPDVTPENLQ
jgi:hypothetical protein